MPLAQHITDLLALLLFTFCAFRFRSILKWAMDSLITYILFVLRLNLSYLCPPYMITTILFYYNTVWRFPHDSSKTCLSVQEAIGKCGGNTTVHLKTSFSIVSVSRFPKIATVFDFDPGSNFSRYG